MRGTENKAVVYQFGNFVLDPNEKILFADGQPLRLPAKEFATLLLLEENKRAHAFEGRNDGRRLARVIR